MSKTALFRFEANPSIGAGHAIRSTVIADELVERGWTCVIITSQASCEFIPALSRFGRVEPVSFDSKPVYADLLVVDHYDLDTVYEKSMRPYTKKIMVIDDLANRIHDCNILLDQTYGRLSGDYKPLVPENCKILTGIDYVLLRKEIRNMRDKALEKREKNTEVKRILVSLGGSDPKNYTLKALEMIVESGFKGKVDVVLGFVSFYKDVLEQYAQQHGIEATFHVNPDMAQLMYDADLCIGAAGSSVWERLYLGLPQVLMQTADNQELIIRFMKSESICFELSDILKMTELVSTFDKLKNYPCSLLYNYFINYLTINQSEDISFRSVTSADLDLIFKWQNIPGLRKYFRNPEIPSYEEHVHWFETMTSNEGEFYIIQYKGNDIGSISVLFNKSNEYEISWYLTPEYHGLGLGFKSLKRMCDVFLKRPLVGYTDKKNIPSIKSFLRAGFIQAENGGFYA